MAKLVSSKGCRIEFVPPHEGNANLAETMINVVTRGARAHLMNCTLGHKA